jgi:hypothetical protein
MSCAEQHDCTPARQRCAANALCVIFNAAAPGWPTCTLRHLRGSNDKER